jgi:hypothetical protein
MIYNWMDDGKTTLRGDWWHVALVRLGRVFVRRVNAGDCTSRMYGLCYRDYDKCQAVTAVMPLNILVRLGYAAWLFAKCPPPARTTREEIEMWKSRATRAERFQ